MTTINCVKCGCSLEECQSYFTRTTPTGVGGIWVCAYPCGQKIPDRTHPLIAAIENKRDSSLPVGPSPINSERGSSEKQDREEPPKTEDLSIAALEANLFFATAKKHKAFEEHKKAIIEEHKALTALNNALRRILF